MVVHVVRVHLSVSSLLRGLRARVQREANGFLLMKILNLLVYNLFLDRQRII